MIHKLWQNPRNDAYQKLTQGNINEKQGKNDDRVMDDGGWSPSESTHLNTFSFFE